MKVSIAAQTLSESVATALDFAREDLGLPQFQGSKPTTEFIRVFNNLLDILNSTNRLGKLYKSPISEETEHMWLPLFGESLIFIRNLRLQDGTPLLMSRFRTGFLGFICDIEAASNLFQDLVVPKSLEYLLTYKFSQDHLELFFACVRSHVGANDNPSCRQFEVIFKRFLVHQDIRVTNGNCTPRDATCFLAMSSGVLKSTKRKHHCESILKISSHEDIPDAGHLLQSLSEYKENVIAYISGYVVKMVEKSISCEECILSLHSTGGSMDHFGLLQRKKYGRLIEASTDVIKVCTEAERLLTHLISQNELCFAKPGFVIKMSIDIKKALFSKSN